MLEVRVLGRLEYSIVEYGMFCETEEEAIEIIERTSMVEHKKLTVIDVIDLTPKKKKKKKKPIKPKKEPKILVQLKKLYQQKKITAQEYAKEVNDYREAHKV